MGTDILTDATVSPSIRALLIYVYKMFSRAWMGLDITQEVSQYQSYGFFMSTLRTLLSVQVIGTQEIHGRKDKLEGSLS